MEKYSSGDVCERCRWQSKRATRSGSRRRARANEFAKCDAVTATGSKRRRRFGNFPARASLTISYFYGEVLKWGASRPPPVADQGRRASGSGQNLAKRTASNKFWAPQQGRRGDADSVTFLQDAFLTIKYFLWRSTQVVEEA